MDVVDTGHRLVVDADDDVADLQAGRFRRAPLVETGDLDARRVRQAQPARDVARHWTILASDPEPAASNAPAGQELADDPRRGIDGDAETDPLRPEDDRRIDSDDAPAGVDQRSPRVA